MNRREDIANMKEASGQPDDNRVNSPHSKRQKIARGVIN